MTKEHGVIWAVALMVVALLIVIGLLSWQSRELGMKNEVIAAMQATIGEPTHLDHNKDSVIYSLAAAEMGANNGALCYPLGEDPALTTKFLLAPISDMSTEGEFVFQNDEVYFVRGGDDSPTYLEEWNPPDSYILKHYEEILTRE